MLLDFFFVFPHVSDDIQLAPTSDATISMKRSWRNVQCIVNSYSI